LLGYRNAHWLGVWLGWSISAVRVQIRSGGIWRPRRRPGRRCEDVEWMEGAREDHA